MFKRLFQSMNNLKKSCFGRNTRPIGELVLVKWFLNQIYLLSNFSNTLSINDMRLIGRRDFAWDKSFPGLGIKTILTCLQLIGIYPKAKVALSSINNLHQGSSKPC
jgi:hypothetical protein